MCVCFERKKSNEISKEVTKRLMDEYWIKVLSLYIYSLFFILFSFKFRILFVISIYVRMMEYVDPTFQRMRVHVNVLVTMEDCVNFLVSLPNDKVFVKI